MNDKRMPQQAMKFANHIAFRQPKPASISEGRWRAIVSFVRREILK